MDDTDRQLIALLRDNARLPVVALAAKLRVARATVQNRLARLEREGVIVGYTVRLKPEAEAQRIRALTSIEVAGHHGEVVRRQLLGHPNVVALHTTNGRWDLVAELAPTAWSSSTRCSAACAASRASPTPRPRSCCPPTRPEAGGPAPPAICCRR